MYKKIFLYWNTIRYLKFVQIYGRIWFKFYKPKIHQLKHLPISRKIKEWTDFADKPRSFFPPHNFQFLNINRHCPDAHVWNSPSIDKLWLYNLHYFDDLSSKEPSIKKEEAQQGLILRWIEENPKFKGVGWEPYPTSLRIVNWIKWDLKHNLLDASCLKSLYLQTQWLSKRIEWHLLGNHLFANAKALVFAGCFFEGRVAQKWLLKGVSIIKKQIREQVLTDGGHFELSPMYHSIFLEDVLDIINILEAQNPQDHAELILQLKNYVPQMIKWLEEMVHPDGQISFFNDSAFNIAPNLSELISYAQRLEIFCPNKITQSPTSSLRASLLKESGYARMESPSAVCLLDVAKVGPDYLPGHAHADILSFELSIFGQRLVVNGGTSCYGLSPERHRQRSTRLHSTLELDSQNSSEVWGGFRVGKRATPFDLKIISEADHIFVSCSHDGYKRLDGKSIHTRTWDLKNNLIAINDLVTGKLPGKSIFIIHPNIEIQLIDNNHCCLKTPNNKMIIFSAPNNMIEIHETTYQPEFGKTIPTKSIELNLQNGKSTAIISWE